MPERAPARLLIWLPDPAAAAAARAAGQGGWIVRRAACRDSALASLQEGAFDAVALDARAACADGYRLVHTARRAWPWVRLVFAFEGEPPAQDLEDFGAGVREPGSPEAWRSALAAAGAAAPALPVRDWAVRDALTGLHNRRYFDAMFAQCVALAGRHGRPLGVALLDLDGFKRVNERHGHAGGDRLLRRVADAFRAAARASDILARYGGDEFALLCPETDAAGLCAAVERLAAAAAAGGAACEGLRLSAGVAAWTGDEPAGTLFARADAALREAKRSGGARVVAAAAPGA